MRRTLLAALSFTAVVAWGQAAGAATISISCGAVGAELQLCKEGAEAWAKKSGNEVKVVSTPNSATERLALYQQMLAAGSADIDVYQIDVIWPGILVNQLLDLSKYVSKEQLDQHFKAIVDNNTVKGKLVAMPWYTDAGVLYYRKDLLEKYGKKPPETWQELQADAQEIADKERSGNAQMQGFVFQAKAYEGLTCDALEWVHSFGGGTIVDDSGKITINNPKAAEALDWAASLIGKVAPEGVLNYSEEEARGVFQSGNAVFMRNWPYAWALSQAPDSPVKDKVGVAVLPKGGADGEHTAVLGGWQLAVSKYSKNADAAADLVKYLTSAEEQKRRAIQGSYNPTIAALYKDPEVLKAVPFFGSLYETFTHAVARPSKVTGEKYNQVSAEFFNTAHQVLGRQSDGKTAVAGLEKRLDRLSRGGHW
jgi:trehalose/maltose transport system substrate-binding protein